MDARTESPPLKWRIIAALIVTAPFTLWGWWLAWAALTGFGEPERADYIISAIMAFLSLGPICVGIGVAMKGQSHDR